ncbi:YfhO family protein, partial [Candidatus Dependentiae bacterium]|nr:YfhO family protein [Candidatus Dependentiae bacterium]
MKYKSIFFIAAAVLVFFYKPVFLGFKIFYYDMSLMLYPYMEFSTHLIKKGVFPAWNPYLFCGFPIFAANQAGIFYPIYLIFRFLFNPADMYSASIIFHFFIMTLFTYFLIRELKLNRTVSLFGAISFGFSGFMTAHHFNIGIISARSWIPLILLFFFKYKKSGNPMFALAAGIILFIQLLIGHPQPSFNTIVFILLFSTASFIFENKKKIDELKKIFIFIFIFTFIGIGLSAIQILPTYEFSKTIERTQGDRYNFMVMRSMPVYNILNLVYPDFAGNPCENSYIGKEGYDEFTIYYGIISLWLSIIAVRYLWKTENNIKLFTVLSFIVLLFGLGGNTPIFKILYYIPGFKLFRAPARFLLFFELFMCILASYGFNFILLNNFVKSKRFKFLTLLFTVFFFGFSIIMFTTGTRLKTSFNKIIAGEFQKKNRLPENSGWLSKISVNPKRVDIEYFTGKVSRLIEGYKSTGIIMFLIYFSVFILLFHNFDLQIKKYLIILLLISELFVFFQRNVPAIDKKFFETVPETVKYLKEYDTGFYRVYSWNRGMMYYDLKKSSGLNNDFSDYYNLMNFIPEDLASLYRIFGFWGYDTMISRRLAEYRSMLLKNNFQLLKIAGVKYVITDIEIPVLETIKKLGKQTFIQRVENVLPQFYIANKIIVKDKSQILDLIIKNDFDYQNCVVIEKNCGITDFSEKSINTVIKNIKWSFDETSLEVDNPNEKPVMLIFNDSYYHCL